MEVPIEVCDLNPQKICRFATKMSPRLTPKKECTLVPKESCTLNFSKAKPIIKKILSKWCLDNPEEDLNLPAVADPRMLQIDDDDAYNNNDSPSQQNNRLPDYKSKVEIIPTEAPNEVTATDTIEVVNDNAVTDYPDIELAQFTDTTTTPIQLEYSTLLPPTNENNVPYITFDFSGPENEVETGTEPPPLRSYGVAKTYHVPKPEPPRPFNNIPSNLASYNSNNLAGYNYPQEKEQPKASQFEVDLSRVNFPSPPIASGVQPPSVRVREQDRHQTFRGGLSLHDDLFPPPPPPSSNSQRFARDQKKSGHHKV